MTFVRNGSTHRAALVNNFGIAAEKVREASENAIAQGDVDMIWIVSSDEIQQDKLQKAMIDSTVSNRVAFATHQEIYKSGVVKSKWQSVNKQYAPVIAESVVVVEHLNWNPTLATA